MTSSHQKNLGPYYILAVQEAERAAERRRDAAGAQLGTRPEQQRADEDGDAGGVDGDCDVREAADARVLGRDVPLEIAVAAVATADARLLGEAVDAVVDAHVEVCRAVDGAPVPGPQRRAVEGLAVEGEEGVARDGGVGQEEDQQRRGQRREQCVAPERRRGPRRGAAAADDGGGERRDQHEGERADDEDEELVVVAAHLQALKRLPQLLEIERDEIADLLEDVGDPLRVLHRVDRLQVGRDLVEGREQLELGHQPEAHQPRAPLLPSCVESEPVRQPQPQHERRHDDQARQRAAGCHERSHHRAAVALVACEAVWVVEAAGAHVALRAHRPTQPVLARLADAAAAAGLIGRAVATRADVERRWRVAPVALEQRQPLEGDAGLGCGVVVAARGATHAVAAVPAGVAAEGLRVELVCLAQHRECRQDARVRKVAPRADARVEACRRLAHGDRVLGARLARALVSHVGQLVERVAHARDGATCAAPVAGSAKLAVLLGRQAHRTPDCPARARRRRGAPLSAPRRDRARVARRLALALLERPSGAAFAEWRARVGCDAAGGASGGCDRARWARMARQAFMALGGCCEARAVAEATRRAREWRGGGLRAKCALGAEDACRCAALTLKEARLALFARVHRRGVGEGPGAAQPWLKVPTDAPAADIADRAIALVDKGLANRQVGARPARSRNAQARARWTVVAGATREAACGSGCGLVGCLGAAGA